MKKLSTTNVFILVSLLSFLVVPVIASAADHDPWVNCGNQGQAACDWPDVAVTLTQILNDIITWFAVPLGTIAIIVGGIMMLVSAGNTALAAKGKQVVITAIIGLLLAVCTKLIINFILTTIGYRGAGI